MEPTPESFFQRLQTVLLGRAPTSWALRVGWNKAAIHAVSRGHVPGPELLMRAARAENLSLDWWLEGVGPMFRVTRCFTVKQTLAAIEQLQADRGPWDVHVVRAGVRAALVLTRNEQVLYETTKPPRQIRYQRVEVIAGGVGQDAIQAALPEEPFLPMPPHQRPARGYEVLTSVTTLDELESGHMGTYLIGGAGWEPTEITPLLEQRVRIDDRQHYVGRSNWATRIGDQAPLVLTPAEGEILERYRRLAPPQRESVGSILAALVEAGR